MPIGGAKDPLVSLRFGVEIGNVVHGSFRECSGLGSETELVETKEAGPKGATVYRKVPGAMKWENITLKRGITDSMEIWKWRKKVEKGDVQGARMNGSIIMYDSQNREVARWNFVQGWPRKVTGPSMNAQNNEVGIEEMEIVHEGLERVS